MSLRNWDVSGTSESVWDVLGRAIPVVGGGFRWVAERTPVRSRFPHKSWSETCRT